VRLGHAAYLWHLLVWTLPVLCGQLALLWLSGRDQFGRTLRKILPPALWMTAYLTAADHMAIGAGIWHFDPEQILGVYFGAVPLEEALFFLITNLLVAFGFTLIWRSPFRSRGACRPPGAAL
jgi:lycopene cyclase domain-containing protein